MPPPYKFRGNKKDPADRPDHEFTFRYPRPGTAERPLLRNKRESTPELLFGGETGQEKPGLKFASLEDLSDSEEAEMELSGDDEEEEEGDAPPRKKRALGVEKPVEASAPRWSNPDPYTVLPPPSDVSGKKIDVVKLIRKARIAANAARSATAEGDAVVTNEDFISLGLDLGGESSSAPQNAPKGPKGELRDSDPALGNRKRTHDDEIKGYFRKPQKPIGSFYYDGSIIDQWAPASSDTAAPWIDSMEPSLHLSSR